MDIDAIQSATRTWLERVVIGLNLCPFAGRELDGQRIHFEVTLSQSKEQLLLALQAEITRLDTDSGIATTLLIHPNVLTDFLDYNQFLESSDALLVDMDRVGTYQIASFHPRYQFAETEQDDAENYTNRSPYPMLHLLREADVERAIGGHPDVDNIPYNNIKTMNDLGSDNVAALFRECLGGE